MFFDASQAARRKNRRAFSLVEIMVVIAIIGLLAGVVTINVRGRMAKARETVARQDIANIVSAIDQFWAEYKRYPTSDEGLAVLYTKSQKYPDTFLTKEPVDPWGRSYVYVCPGSKGPYEVICRGPDGHDTGQGVISSDDLPPEGKSVKRSAFTLIEITMVMLILAITSAAVVLKIQRPLRSADSKDAVGAIMEYDKTTRSAACLQDRALQLVISLGDSSLWRADQAGRMLPVPPLRLSGRARVSRVLLGAKDYRDGKAVITCSSKGFTPTYAMYMDNGGEGQWLVVAGLSGQLVQVSNEDEAKKIVAASSRGHHAG